jgi:predicted MFS family arabinose efflux permease
VADGRPPWLFRYAPHFASMHVGYLVFAYASIPDVFRLRLGVSFADLGLLMSAALGAIVVVQVPAGRLVDRYSASTVLLAGTLASATLAVTLDLAGTFRSLLAARFLWGVAVGVIVTAATTQIARTHRGRSVTVQSGLFAAMTNVGGAVGFLLAPRLVSGALALPVPVSLPAGGIHTLGVLLAAPTVAGLLAYWGSGAAVTAPSESDRGASDAGATLAVLRDPVVVAAALGNAAVLGSYVTLSTFVTDFYSALGVVLPLNVAVLLFGGAGRAGGGFAVRFAEDRVVLAASATLATAGFLALAASPGDVLGPALLVLPALTMVAVSLPNGAAYGLAAGSGARHGPALSVVVAAGNTAAVVLPVVAGAIRDATGGYGLAFVVLAAVNVLAVAGALRIRSR